MNKKVTIFAIAIAGIALLVAITAIDWRTRIAQAPTPLPESPQPSTSKSPETSALIRVTTPQPNTIITSPMSISGEARGAWFFEASFPIRLEDSSGKVIASTTAQTKSDWMTTEFVPFQATLAIPQKFNGPAVLVLEKDNPSGLPQNADAIRISVTIKMQ